MPSEITVRFEFEIGETVYFRIDRHTAASRPNAYMVAERVAQEFHGGVQRCYHLVGRGLDLAARWPELVLTREMPPLEKRTREETEEALGQAIAGTDWLPYRKEQEK